MKDDLGTRMKSQYENRTRYFLPRRTYTIVRLDGKSFHTFTRGMEKPFDPIFVSIMDKTALFLASNIQGCQIAYVQSDEISLLLTDFDKITTDAWFDGNIQKIVSVSAAMAAAQFNQLFYINAITDKALRGITNTTENPVSYMKDIFNKMAFFDSRVFTIPDPIEVENYFIWRQKDAVRNSISMTAQSLYSHKELNGKSQSDMQEMIFQKGKNWNDINCGFKRGRTFIKREDGWTLECPDFLKDREWLRSWIPKIDVG
jgi:tRNA(His) guanylyltransferase